jgi:hypothetical protein
MLGFLAGALALIALAVPPSAFAGTYTWNLANDFTATPPGANPDNDQYGATPWSYKEGATTSALKLLPKFESAGGLAFWEDSSTGGVVGVNDSEAPVTGGSETFEPSQIYVEPEVSPVGGLTAVGWTSPLSQTETVTINGSVNSDDNGAGMPPCAYSTSWNVVGPTGASLAASSAPGGTGPFSVSASVAPGATIYVTFSNPVSADAGCDASALALDITAPATAPAVSVTQPASGSSTTVEEPTFSGAASAGFGDSSQVTLRVYSGNAVSGTPVQTVNATRSGGAWSVTLGSALALGTYTAQAEQDDVVGDVGLSTPVTFGVGTPVVILSSPGSTPLPTSTPTLTGTAGTEASDQAFVVVSVYAGSTATGAAIRALTAPVAASGQFAAQVTPALPDGTYTAVATQGDAAGTAGISAPQTFSVDTLAPTVTLLRPLTGSRSDLLKLVFNGGAAAASFDSHLVTITLYKGRKAAGKRYGTANGSVVGSTWSATWPGKLPPGTYTVQVSQTDAVGHIGLSAAHTFRVIAPPPVIGSVTFKGGRVSLKITCNEPARDTCSGNVLVLSQGNFEPLAGGPVGPLTVMFAFIRVQGGQTSTIKRTVVPNVATVLRHRRSLPVTISASLHPLSGPAIHATHRENLRRQ